MAELMRVLRRLGPSVDTHYLGKWLLISGLVGVVAGVGAIAIFTSITWATELFLGLGAEYVPPGPAGEGETIVEGIGRRWMIPVVTTLGGLLSGLIVFKLAPEAEGHGTDAAIEAFHRHGGQVRTRIPLVKLVASAITIGSGGSAGREGPTAQIAAGFGSLLGKLLHLSTADRRVAVAVGIGSGIGAIFKAPLGGALLSTEVLYLQGFEVAALIPSFIASIIGYSIFAAWSASGFTPIFGDQLSVSFNDPLSLGFYAVLGLLAGIAGWLYSRSFYGVQDLFRLARLPDYIKPALGGLIVGVMALFLPQVLGMGYGWIQLSMDSPERLGLGLMVVLVFAKILATALTVGSGGSGGVFAPGLFVGGMVGAALWSTVSGMDHAPATPAPFVIVGMMALFGGIARAPLAVMLMVSEMTASYTMLAPAMVAVGISYIITGRDTIYRSQEPSPAESPAHRYEYSLPLLSRIRVRDAMETEVGEIPGDTTMEQAVRLLQEDHAKSLPVVDQGTRGILGMLSVEDVLRYRASDRNGTRVTALMSREVVTTHPNESLDAVLDLLSQHDISSLPVVERKGRRAVLVGIINRADVIHAYQEHSKRFASGDEVDE